MGRPRLPNEILALNGAFKVNPGRRRESAKSEQELGEPAQHLSDAAAAIWVELAFNAPAGVLTGHDRPLFARLCQLEEKLRFGGEMSASEGSQHLKCLTLLGMSPVDRTRIVATKPEDTSIYAEFLE